jgi:hypothetical protein
MKKNVPLYQVKKYIYSISNILVIPQFQQPLI